MRVYTRQAGSLRAVEFEEGTSQEQALDLINVKHMAVRRLKEAGVIADKRAPILLCINNDYIESTDSVA